MNSSSGARDRTVTRITASLFGTSSGALSVLVPLALIEAGNLAVVVGAVSMLAGVSQLVARFCVPILMRQFADKFIVVLAVALIAIAALLPLLSTLTVVIAVTQLVHGAVRALFWTSLQTHAVRGRDRAVRGIADVVLFTGIGLVVGPAFVALINSWLNLSASFILALILAIGGTVAAVFLRNFGPFAAHRGIVSRRALTRPVMFGSWMSGVAAAWRGLLDTYLPVILVAASFSSSGVSGLIAVSAGAMLVGNFIAPRIGNSHRGAFYIIGTTVTSLSFAALLIFGHYVPVALAVMFLCGFISGLFQTYGAAVAADSVDEDLKGDAITVTGIFRSVIILGIPGLMSALLPFVGLTALSLAVAGGINAFSLAAVTARAKRDPDRGNRNTLE